MQTIIAKCGNTINVPKDHATLRLGVFGYLDLGVNTNLDLDFLNFVFFSKSSDTKLLEYAKQAHICGLHDLAREVYLRNIDFINVPTEEMVAIFAWDEMPDRIASQILNNPTNHELSKIVKLGYVECYKKFSGSFKMDNYREIAEGFLDFIISEKGIEQTFIICCANGHLEIVKKIMTSKFDIKTSRIAIASAASGGHIEVTKFLLSENNNTSQDVKLAYGKAVINGHIELAKYLAELDETVRLENKRVIGDVIANGHVEMLKFLLPSVTLKRNFVQAMATKAAGKGCLEMLQFLSFLGFFMGTRDILMRAIGNGRRAIVEFLASIGTKMDFNSGEAMKCAIKNNDRDMVEMLLSFNITVGGDIDKTLKYATYSGSFKVAKLLLTLGADIKYDNNLLLRTAIRRNKKNMIRSLLTPDFPELVKSERELGLDIARSSVGMLEFLVSLGLDPRFKNDLALKCAIEQDDVKKVEYLISLFDDPNVGYSLGVKEAFVTDNRVMMKYFGSVGAKLGSESEWVISKAVVDRRSLDYILLLASIGGNVAADNNFPLRWAVENGNSELAKCLVSLGADVCVYKAESDRLSKVKRPP